LLGVRAEGEGRNEYQEGDQATGCKAHGFLKGPNVMASAKVTLFVIFDNVYSAYIHFRGRLTMGTAKVFRSGNSQAVRLPKQFRLKSKEVEIFRRGKEIVLREKDGTMARAFDLLAGLPDDLVVERGKDRPQKRKGL